MDTEKFDNLEVKTESPSPLQTAMKWGFYTGVGLIGFSLLFYILDTIPNNGWQFLAYFILFGGIFWGSKTYRDTELGGFISYGKALRTGVLISLFASIIMALYLFVFLSFIDPDQMQKALEIAEQDMLDKNYSDQQIEMGMEMARKFSTPSMLAIGSILIYTFVGFMLSLFTSIGIKKNKPFFEN